MELVDVWEECDREDEVGKEDEDMKTRKKITLMKSFNNKKDVK
jgi:hypothetical protein